MSWPGKHGASVSCGPVKEFGAPRLRSACSAGGAGHRTHKTDHGSRKVGADRLRPETLDPGGRSSPMLLRSFAALLLLCSAAHADDACPRRGGELTLPFAPDPADLTPGKNAQYAPSLVFDEIYDTLLRMDRKGVLGPGLATKYEVAKDNLSIVFTLRQGVLFHHGREFEAK